GGGPAASGRFTVSVPTAKKPTGKERSAAMTKETLNAAACVAKQFPWTRTGPTKHEGNPWTAQHRLNGGGPFARSSTASRTCCEKQPGPRRGVSSTPAGSAAVEGRKTPPARESGIPSSGFWS